MLCCFDLNSTRISAINHEWIHYKLQVLEQPVVKIYNMALGYTLYKVH